MKCQSYLKGVVYKFWIFFYYWPDLSEISTWDVKLKKTVFVHVKFSDSVLVYYVFKCLWYINIYV